MNPLLHTSKVLRLLAVGIACCAAVLAGCSGDESSDETTTTTAAETETDETTNPDDESTDTDSEISLPDTPLCQLASEESPDLSALPDLLPEELRDEATQFAQEYNEWRDSDGEQAPPEATEGIIAFITQECTPQPADRVEPDAPAG